MRRGIFALRLLNEAQDTRNWIRWRTIFNECVQHLSREKTNQRRFREGMMLWRRSIRIQVNYLNTSFQWMKLRGLMCFSSHFSSYLALLQNEALMKWMCPVCSTQFRDQGSNISITQSTNIAKANVDHRGQVELIISSTMSASLHGYGRPKCI